MDHRGQLHRRRRRGHRGDARRCARSSAPPGVSPKQLILDPGLGFAKDARAELGTAARPGPLHRPGPPRAGGHQPQALPRLPADRRRQGRRHRPNATPPPRPPARLAAANGAWGVRVHDVGATLTPSRSPTAWSAGPRSGTLGKRRCRRHHAHGHHHPHAASPPSGTTASSSTRNATGSPSSSTWCCTPTSARQRQRQRRRHRALRGAGRTRRRPDPGRPLGPDRDARGKDRRGDPGHPSPPSRGSRSSCTSPRRRSP